MIHPAGMFHAPAMAMIHAACFVPAETWSEAGFRTLLASPGISGLVDGQGGFILVRQAADEADVVTLAVLAHARRTGVARRLLGAALAQMHRQGVARLVLEVADANLAALALYRTTGFAEIGRRPGYYAGGGDALVMSIAVAAHAPDLPVT